MPSDEALIQSAVDYWAELFRKVTDFSWYDADEDTAFMNARRALEEVIGTNEATAPNQRDARFSTIINRALGQIMLEAVDNQGPLKFSNVNVEIQQPTDG